MSETVKSPALFSDLFRNELKEILREVIREELGSINGNGQSVSTCRSIWAGIG